MALPLWRGEDQPPSTPQWLRLALNFDPHFQIAYAAPGTAPQSTLWEKMGPHSWSRFCLHRLDREV